MKTSTFLYMTIAGAMAFGMISCSDEDENIHDSSVPVAVTQSFKAKYPNVKNVDWSINQQYYVADFNMNTFDTEAWFTSDGTWAMTETDYETMQTMLPLQVSDAFNQSQYASWIVDDITFYEKPIDSFYVIEVENSGTPEIALFYDSFGNLINKVNGDCFDITPTTDPASIVI